MNDHIMSLMEERRRSKGTENYKMLNQRVKAECIKAKEKWIERQCDEIEESDQRHNSREVHRKVRELANKGDLKAGLCIKSKDGKMLFSSDEVTNRWQEYISELYSDQDRSHIKPDVPNCTSGPEILTEEVESAIKKLRLGKAAGRDSICAELLKHMGETGLKELTFLCNLIYDTGYIPKELNQSIFITLPKKPGATDCSNFRTISIMSQVTKIFLAIIQNRIKQKVDEELAEDQFGFRKGKGTREAVSCVRNLLERAIEMQNIVYLCFIDYRKAFDRIKHDQLVQDLKEINIDGKDLRVIINLYWNQVAAVRVGTSCSDFVPIERGVRQGCVMSPVLYNLYAERITRSIQQLEGFSVGGRNINSIRYADDTTIIASSEDALQHIITEVDKRSREIGLEINEDKTKTMTVHRSLQPVKNEIMVNGKKLDQVEKFKLLGHTITSDGRCEQELKTRIAMAKSNFNCFKKILTCRKISLTLRLRLTKAYVWSTLLYCCEVWTITSVMEKKIAAFEMWCYRRILRISWKEKKTNDEVLQMLGMTRCLLKIIMTRQLRYFGHIVRHNSMQHDILDGRIPGRRARGRQRLKWSDNFRRVTGFNQEQLRREAQDREGWRSVVANLRIGDGT